jgi:hypothetical protein
MFQINIISIANHVGAIEVQLQLGSIMPKRGPKGKYNVSKPEQRGRVSGEPVIYNSFWKKHTMDEIMALSPAELDKVINDFLDDFIAKAKKRNPRWSFPDKIVTKLVRKKVNSDKYKAEPFNKSFKNLDNGNPFIV